MPILPFKTRQFLGLFFLCIIIIAACKKEKAAEKTAAVYSISYTGGQYVGETVYFTTNAPASSSFVWHFADSTTSSIPTPSHTYTTAGAYSAFLVVNSTDTSRITVCIGIDSVKMLTISGSYLWSHTYSEYFSSGVGDTTIDYSDIIMPVLLINPATVSVGMDTLTYNSSASNCIVFSHSSSSGNSAFGEGSFLYFYTRSDTLNYQMINWQGLGIEWDNSYTTP